MTGQKWTTLEWTITSSAASDRTFVLPPLAAPFSPGERMAMRFPESYSSACHFLVGLERVLRLKSTRCARVFRHARSRVCTRARACTDVDIIQYNVGTSDIIWSGAQSASGPGLISTRSQQSADLWSPRGVARTHVSPFPPHLPPFKPVFWRARFFSAVSFSLSSASSLVKPAAVSPTSPPPLSLFSATLFIGLPCRFWVSIMVFSSDHRRPELPMRGARGAIPLSESSPPFDLRPRFDPRTPPSAVRSFREAR